MKRFCVKSDFEYSASMENSKACISEHWLKIMKIYFYYLDIHFNL